MKEDHKAFKNALLYNVLHDVNTFRERTRTLVNTGAKGNLVTAERNLNILQFESLQAKGIEGSKYVYCTCLK